MSVSPEADTWIRLDELGKAHDEIEHQYDERMASHGGDAFTDGLLQAMRILRDRAWAHRGGRTP